MPEAIAGGSHPPDPMMMTELPTLSLESITHSSWTDVELIRNCCNCFGREHLLHEDTYSPTQPKTSVSSIPLSFMPCELVINERKSWEDINKMTNHWNSATGCNNQDLTGCTSFMEIYICYHCEREFTNKDAMRIHQNACSHRPDNQPGMQTPPPPQPPPPPAPSRSSKTLSTRGEPVRPVTCLLNEDDPHKAGKEGFLKYFQLVQTQKAERLKSELKLGQNADVDCQIIDVEPRGSVQQTSPRTPKSLISQLSREGEPGVHRKRLCYPTHTEESDGDSGYSTTGNGVEDIDTFKKSSKTNSLLCIDISSLLGLRIQKHVKAETTLQALPDIEQYCKTPEKNDALERLRTRPIMYPITFRNSKKTNIKYSHEYKFTKAQRNEFMKLVQTGLNKQSRILKRSLKSCNVRLRRLNEAEIKKWTTPKRDARVNIQPLTHDQILLWTSKREYLKDSQNISSVYPWSPQKFSSKSFPQNRSSGPMRRIGYHYYKMGSPALKKVKKIAHPMTIYKSVYSTNSTSKPKSLSGVHQFVPSMKHTLNDSLSFTMRHPSQLSRFLANHHVPKVDQNSPHYNSTYRPVKTIATEPLTPQSYRNLPNSALAPQFLVKCVPPETQNCASSPPVMVIPVSGVPPTCAAPEQVATAITNSHGLPSSHSVVPNSQEPLKLVIKSQANTPNELKLHDVGDDNVSIHTISSDSEDDELSWISRCTICQCGPCQCPTDNCFRFPSRVQSKPHYHTLDHGSSNSHIADQNVVVGNANINAVENSPLRVIVNYNKHNKNNHHHNNNSVSADYPDSNSYLSSACDQQLSPKHVYAPIIKSVGHHEKQILKQFHSESPDMCTSSPLKVINRVDHVRSGTGGGGNKQHYANEMVENHADGASLSHNKYYNQQRTKSWHSAYNSSNKIRIQKVPHSPRPNNDLDDDDIQILEEVICID